ncbi:RNase adapter RapZ [Corynebacterium neomassiliense]|uniref:RNase adapter RapZ n=1 Tax=Corynebacterium neomassiliense TaxID=2079482 RepID=UPI001030AEE4|nr:RNase adapter RapZ [Corynebacterium neomassiliense]
MDNRHVSSPAPRQEASLVLITGMSGAGRKEAATVLEEMGWYVADNLPPELIMRMVELSFESHSPVERLAIVTDVRSRDFVGSLTEVLAGLHDSGRRPVVLYLDADDATLVRRYGQLRRTHPLQDGETLQAGINREREMLEGIRQRADIVIDTTGTSVHDLRRQLEDYFTALSDRREHVTVQSFGFKNGAPRDLDLMFDARFLPNPYWEPELREHSGLEAAVADYVLDRPEARDYLDAVQRVVETALPGYRREGKRFITVGVGCTGGQHRSPAVAEALAARLSGDEDLEVRTVHRDLVKYEDRFPEAGGDRK